jgi:hypothetical protein
VSKKVRGYGAVSQCPSCGSNTAFVERLNLDIRQRVAAVGQRVNTLCQGEDDVRQQLALYHCYYNFCLPHASLRQPLPQRMATNGTGSAKQWRRFCRKFSFGTHLEYALSPG